MFYLSRLTRLNHKLHGRELQELRFHGGFLLTSPLEDFTTPAVHEDLADESGSTADAPTVANILAQHAMPGYGTINQTPSSLGYSSGAELQELPLNESLHPGSSDSSQPSSNNPSSQQDATSSSQPLLGHAVHPTRRNARHRQSGDATV